MFGDLAVRLFERSAAAGDYMGEVDGCPFLDLDDGDWLGLLGFALRFLDFLSSVGGERISILLRGASVPSGLWFTY